MRTREILGIRWELRFLISGEFGFFRNTTSNMLRMERARELELDGYELELELIQIQMAQKPMLRAEVHAHAMHASQNRKKEVRREKEV